MTIKAHFQPSNSRVPTDSYLVPDHYDFEYAQKQELEHLKGKYEFISISDEEVSKLRELTRNRLTFADAFEYILKSKLPSMKTMLYWSTVQNLGLENAEDGFEEFDAKSDQENLEKALQDVESNAKVTVVDAIYVDKETFYFFK